MPAAGPCGTLVAVTAVVVRPAVPEEAAELSALALRSKAHWGYDEAFLEAGRDDLAVAPGDCDGSVLWVAGHGSRVLGFSRQTEDVPCAVLDDLWVDPPAIGTGVGRLLLASALDRAAAAGATRLRLDADPHAEGFYLRAGAVRVGTVPSPVLPGRELPRLEFTLPIA